MSKPVIGTVFAWGITWFKNFSKLGGAQNMAMQYCGEGEVVVHSQTVKHGRMWGCATPEQLVALTASNHGVYEVLTKFPHKAYFDLDMEGDHEDYLEKAEAEIQRILPGAELAVSGSRTEKKTSYHVVVQNYVIRSIDDRKAIRIMFKKMVGFDKAVYTTNRNMKCANQSKLDGRVQAIVYGEPKEHLIMCYLKPDALPIPVPETIKEEIEIKRSMYDMSTLPELFLPENLDIETMSPLEIMNAFPLTPEWVFKDAARILCFAFHNGIQFDQFLAWAHRKHTDDFKWGAQWLNAFKYRPVGIESMRQTLRHFYPNSIKRDHFWEFKETFKLPEAEKVETLSQACFLRHGITCVNIGMGGGKTAQTCDFIKNDDYCWISPNIALASNLKARTGATFYKDIPQAEKHAGIKARQLLICMNSLRYVGKTYKTIVLDESETILMKWMGDFMKHKDKTWLKFVELIQSAKRVILLDAFTSTKTLDIIRSIRSGQSPNPLRGCTRDGEVTEAPSIRLIERLVEPKTRTVHYVRQFGKMVDRMRADLRAGRKIFIFYPQKTQTNKNISMEGLHDLLSEEGTFPGIFYNSEIDETIKRGLADVNEAWRDKRFVITNTTITCGVNFDREDSVFDTAYLFIASYTMPRDALQVSYRPRKLTSGSIFTHFMGGMHAKEVWEDDGHQMKVEGSSVNGSLAAQHYRDLYAANLCELKAPNRKTFEFLCTKAGYRQTTDDADFAEETAKMTREMLEDHATGYKYIGLPNITGAQAEKIKEKMFDSTATQIEKYTVGRFFFRDQFREDARDKCEAGWDNQWIRMTRQIIHEDQLFKDIAAHNGFDGFPVELGEVKLTEHILNDIFKQFQFKFLTPKSAVAKILMQIYNEFYGLVYTSKCEGKNTTISLVDGVGAYYGFVKWGTCGIKCSCKKPTLGKFGLCGCGGFYLKN
jgi:hypothetical protein